jgi:hypothetical protein
MEQTIDHSGWKLTDVSAHLWDNFLSLRITYVIHRPKHCVQSKRLDLQSFDQYCGRLGRKDVMGRAWGSDCSFFLHSPLTRWPLNQNPELLLPLSKWRHTVFCFLLAQMMMVARELRLAVVHKLMGGSDLEGVWQCRAPPVTPHPPGVSFKDWNDCRSRFNGECEAF